MNQGTIWYHKKRTARGSPGLVCQRRWADDLQGETCQRVAIIRKTRKSSFSCFALIGIILIAFVAIVLIANYIGLPDGLSIPFVSGPDHAATTHNSIFDNTTSQNGIVLTSMMRSVDLVVAASGGSKWVASNPGWYLDNARADFADSQGLSQHWTLALRTDTSALVAVINNGQVSSVTVQDIPQSPDATANETDGEVVEQYPEYNSTTITSQIILARTSSIRATP